MRQNYTMKNYLSHVFAIFAVIMGTAAISVFCQTTPGSFAGIDIRNFGQMDEHYYRGAQPEEKDYAKLKALGINTIIDLQIKPTKYEKADAEALGMKYINIPMYDDKYPTDDAINTFLKEVNDPANGTVYVHCKGGRHRTGVTGAVYRMTKYGWDYDKSMQEMLNYNFDTSYGRKVMKDFVVDYAAKTKSASASRTAAGSAN